MSYNTDLQNNNTSLQEILATVNALPEAGGTSGGGSEIETVEVNLYCSFGNFTVYYINENLEPAQLSLIMDDDIYIQVLKNSILVAIVPVGALLEHRDNIEALYKENSTAIYHIYGNGLISL